MCGKDSSTILEILDIINKNGRGIAFILNSKDRFTGLVTDGDIRRAILKGISLESPVTTILNTNPIVVKPTISQKEVLNLMIKKKLIYTIPVLNDKMKVIDYHLLTDFIKEEFREIAQSSHVNNEKDYILLIGGAGYIGSVLSRYLLDKNCKVRVLDKLLFGVNSIEELLENPNFELIEGDYLNITLLIKSLENVSVVVHLAAIVGDPAGKMDPDLTKEINQYGVKILAELCKYKNINRFIFISTCSIYGYYKDKILTENSDPNPLSLYAETKLKAENLVILLADSNFHPTVIRLATVFGLSNRMRFDLVINLLAAKAINENKITIFSSDQWRPFVHVKDVARAIYTILISEKQKISGEIFNIGGNELNYKIKDLVPIYKKVFPSLVILENNEKEDERSYRVGFDKVKNIINFKTKYLIEDCLTEIKAYFNIHKSLNYKDNIYSNVKNFKYGILNSLFIIE